MNRLLRATSKTLSTSAANGRRPFSLSKRPSSVTSFQFSAVSQRSRQRLIKYSYQQGSCRSLSSSSSEIDKAALQELLQSGGLEKLNLSAAARKELQEQLQALHHRQQQSTSSAAATTTASATAVPEPAYEDLKAVAFTTAVPFVGFGFMDNAILIVAGDAIDTSLGVVLGISTMCAAAIGNIVSDVAGILLGTAIEDFCAKYLNLPTPNLTNEQRQLRSVRFANQFGCAVGIVIGCIIGMFPLFFLDSKKIQARKRERYLDSIFRDVITEAGSLIGAQRTCLFLIVDKSDNSDSDASQASEMATLTRKKTKKLHHPVPTSEGKYLYAKYDPLVQRGALQSERYIPLGRGIVSRAALTGEAWNIYDVRTEPDYTPELGGHDSNEGIAPEEHVRNMVCVPVLDAQGRAIAVIQAINKVGEGSSSEEQGEGDNFENVDSKAASLDALMTPQGGFTTNDVKTLKALASHISVAIQRMDDESGEESDDMGLKETITMLKEYRLHGIAGDLGLSTDEGSLKLFPEA